MSALLNKANGVMDTSALAMSHISEATKSLQSVSAKIDRGEGTVGALINDREMYNDLKQTSATARGIATSAQAGVADFQEDMEALKHNFLLRGYFKSRGYQDASDIGKDEIGSLPIAQTLKEFSFGAKDLFVAQNTAELKNQKALNLAGEFLASEPFGVAVIVVQCGSVGDKDGALLVARARGMIIRDYLVGHYGFDDSRLKTIAIAKETDGSISSGWGAIRLIIYPTETPIPANTVSVSTSTIDQPSKQATIGDSKGESEPIQ